MKKISALLIIFLSLQCCAFAAGIEAFGNGEKNLKFGLKDAQGKVLVKPEYKKLIRLGDTAWIAQKGSRYGIMDNEGNFLIPVKYRHADRFYGNYALLGNDNDYGLYNQNGEVIIPAEFSKISPLFGEMFLTCKNFKYGIRDKNGKELLGNDFEDIYMPSANVMRIKSDGEWFEIESLSKNDGIKLPENSAKVNVNDREIKVTHVVANTGYVSGYSVVTAADYTLKIFSSISPAYEQTIDDLMFSQGADTITIFTKMSWVPKFPFTYAKHYFVNLKNPNNGPLSEIREDMKKQIK